MAQEITLTVQMTVFKNSIMSSALSRALNGIQFNMLGNAVLDNIILPGVAGSGTITAATNANPIVITTATAHGLVNQQQVTISGVGGNTNANGTWLVSVLSTTTFSIPATGNSAYTSGGTYTSAAVLFLAGGVHFGIFYNPDPTNTIQILCGSATATPCIWLGPQGPSGYGEPSLVGLNPSASYYVQATPAQPVGLEYFVCSP